MLLPQESLDDAAEILWLVIGAGENTRGAIWVVVDLLLGLNYRWNVLNLEAIVAEVEVVGGVEAAPAVDPLVWDKVGETSEDVAADFALVDQIAFARKQFT